MKIIIPNSYDRLTATRFFAATLVLIFHYGQATWPFNAPMLRDVVSWGQTAVSYFFCLSGFILSVVNTGKNRIPVFNFISARFARIAPGYFLALLIVWFFTTKADEPWTLHFFMLQSWVPDTVAHLNIPGWSVGVEVFFYASFPIIYFLMTKLSLRTIFITSASIWILTAVTHHLAYKHFFFTHNLTYGLALLEYFPLMHLNEFVIGCAGGFWAARTAHENKYAYDILGALAATGVLLCLIFSNYIIPWPSIRGAYLNGLLAPLMVLFIACLPRMKLLVWDVLRWTPLLVLGEASYAIYIFQHPILLALHNTQFYWVINPDVSFYYYIGLMIMFSVSFFYLIEDPFRRIARKFTELVGKRASQLGRPTSELTLSNHPSN